MRFPRSDAGVCAAIAGVIFLLFADVLFLGSGFYVRDTTQSYIPFASALREAIFAGDFPHWNRLASAGQPLAANPQYQMFYPGTWLQLLPLFPYGLQLEIVLHIMIVAVGMYWWLRECECSRSAALFGVTSFALGGVVLSATNLLPTLTAIAWWPLLLIGIRRCWNGVAASGAFMVAVALSMILLAADFGMAIQTALLAVAYTFIEARWNPAAIRKSGAWLTGAVVIAIAIASVQLIPALDLKGDTARGERLEYKFVTATSFPPARVGEAFFPHLLGFVTDDGEAFRGSTLYDPPRLPWLFSIYQGILMSLFVVAGMLLRVPRWRSAAVLIALSIALALGNHTPLARVLYDNGILVSHRYPERFIVLGLFVAAIFGASVVDRIVADRRAQKIALFAALTVAMTGLAHYGWTFSPSYPQSSYDMLGAARSAALTGAVAQRGALDGLLRAVGAVILLTSIMRWGGRRHAAILITAFAAIDVGSRIPALAPRMPRQFFDAPPIAAELPLARREGRILQEAEWPGSTERAVPLKQGEATYWLMRNMLYPLTYHSAALQSVLDPDVTMTTLRATTEFQRIVWESGYSGAPDWPAPFLGMSNVAYRLVPDRARVRADTAIEDATLVSAVSVQGKPRYWFADQLVQVKTSSDFQRVALAQRIEEGAVYVNAPSRPLARGEVLSVKEKTNGALLRVRSAGESFLFASVTPHRYWHATVDGKPAPLVAANVGFQGLFIPAGEHVIEMEYDNPLFRRCAVASFIGLVGLALLLSAARRGRAPATLNE